MSTAEEPQDPRLAKVLVVDDDPEILKMLSMRLGKNRGYQVFQAADGQEALAVARESLPDLVILDVMMPKLNGWEVARALRQDEATKTMKIIMLTAIGPHVNELTSPLYGADDHIDKPFDFKVLEAKMADLLNS